MANRHLSRSVVMQTLFEWDFRGHVDSEVSEIIERNVNEFAPGMGDVSFIKDLVQSILAKRPELDEIIEKAAPEWPIDKIAMVDRNILRMGLYELLFADRKEVPAKVAINEAIELAKTFGGETSGKFVNGVLGAVYKELGEPGKDEISKKKKIIDIPYEQMPIQNLVGAVVFAKHDDQLMFAFVHDVFGHWTLSKGKLEKDEDINTGVVRKIKEEIGLDVKVKEELARNEYIATHPEDGKIRKQVVYFLVESDYETLKLKETGGLDDARWFPINQIAELNFYNDIFPIITKAVQILNK